MQFLFPERLLQISRTYNDLIIAQLPESDISTDIDVAILVTLYSNKHQMILKELAGLLNTDATRVSGLISVLVQKGYLYTERNSADCQQHYISLTAKGIALIPALQLAIENLNAVISRHLTDHSLYVFYDVLRQMEANLLARIRPDS